MTIQFSSKDLNEVFRYARKCMPALGLGYFLKIGKYDDKGAVTYWLYVPEESVGNDI